MNTVVHVLFCVCSALVAAEPGLEAALPSAAPVFKVALAVCAAAMMALHYMDPADASAAPAAQPAAQPKQ